jgi:hypothetical protein
LNAYQTPLIALLSASWPSCYFFINSKKYDLSHL